MGRMNCSSTGEDIFHIAAAPRNHWLLQHVATVEQSSDSLVWTDMAVYQHEFTLSGPVATKEVNKNRMVVIIHHKGGALANQNLGKLTAFGFLFSPGDESMPSNSAGSCKGWTKRAVQDTFCTPGHIICNIYQYLTPFLTSFLC